MLIIRLQRTGKKNSPDFRIVLAQKTASAAKKFVEVLGSYNPVKKAFAVKSEERLKYWIAQHVEISPTVHNLLVSKNLLDAKKVRAFNTPKKPSSAEATEGKPAEAVATAETPVEVAEATAEVESKVEAQPAEISAVEAKPSVTESPAAPSVEPASAGHPEAPIKGI